MPGEVNRPQAHHGGSEQNRIALRVTGFSISLDDQLGGFFLVEARDLDKAFQIAGHIPASRWGTVEIDAVVEVTTLPQT